MGNASNKREKYTDHELEEEIELRKYEEEIGGFKKSMSFILPRICIEKDIISISNVESNILKDFSQSFVQFIQQGYFYKEVDGQRYYDARKIKLLLFLLTKDNLIDNSRISYHDKASFIFTFVKTRDDQNLCEALEEKEVNFVKFVEDLVDISCELIVKSFKQVKSVKSDKEIMKFSSIKSQIVKNLIENLFYNKNDQRSGGLSFNELNKKFDDDKFLFTSGYIRDVAWNILSGGVANEIDAKNKEAEMIEVNMEK
jgi:hypothetical protein